MWIVFFRGTNQDGEVCRYGCVNLNPNYSEAIYEVKKYAAETIHLDNIHVEPPAPLDSFAIENIACSWKTYL